MKPLFREAPMDLVAWLPEVDVESRLVLYGATFTGRDPDDEVNVAAREAAEEAAR